ncbi:colicin V production protein [Desulfosporosinus acididurans]|uniref:Colicin V production protein n=1 Tax=Desulfosporosinus acididurans TaxID=476652 RepID=A0A0J1FUK6_9FIRM|nr:CvpA family protein [Desulfosporosinus acididurans]KLU67119.1 colicin V production protein [Desulfosporosinus acididurans]
MNLIDILILGFILFGALSGYRKGLLTSIIHLVSYVVGFLVASWKYNAFLSWIEQYFPLRQWLEPFVYKTILPLVQTKASSLEQQILGNFVGSLPEEWRSVFSSIHITGQPMTQTIEKVSQRLAETLTDRLLNLLAFALVFYGLVLLVQLSMTILLKPLGIWGSALNRGGGLFIGALSSTIGLAVLAGLISPLLKVGFSGGFATLLQTSTAYPYLVKIFNGIDQALATQISQKLIDPLIKEKGIWF